jgi:hypothetical protein
MRAAAAANQEFVGAAAAERLRTRPKYYEASEQMIWREGCSEKEGIERG